jgi:hypothetical protein
MTRRKDRQSPSQESVRVHVAKRKKRQAIEREQHGKSYEEANWSKLSPAFREAHNRLLMMEGEPPIPPPEIDLYVPPKAAEKIKQFDPTDPEFLQSAREFEGPLPNDSEDTHWDTWDDVPDEFQEWARANACGTDVLKAALQQTEKQLRHRLTVHKELFALIRKIHDTYMADPDPVAQPKTKAAAVEQVVKAFEPINPTVAAYDEWVERDEELVKRIAYRALKKTPLWFWLDQSSAYEDPEPFDNLIGPPPDERIARDMLVQQWFSRQWRRPQRRTKRRQSE